jgi:hypothetical protein
MNIVLETLHKNLDAPPGSWGVGVGKVLKGLFGGGERFSKCCRGINMNILSGPLEGGGGNENSRIWSFHLDTLRVPKLVPHPALQPGTEVIDPLKENEGFPGSGGAGIRPSGAGF